MARLARAFSQQLLHCDVLTVPPHVSPLSPPHAAPRPPLVFLHGLLGSGTNWRTVGSDAELRRSRVDVVAMDLPGHGRSPPPHAPLTLEAMADAVAATLQARSLARHADGASERWCVTGHSLGGKVAAMVALRHPAIVRRLAIVDISLVPYETEAAEWQYVARGVSAVAAVDPSQLGSRKEVDEALARANGGALAHEPLLRGFIGQNIVVAPPDGGAGGGALPPPPQQQQQRRLAWRIDARMLAESMAAFADFPAPPPYGPYEPAADLPVLAIRGGNSAFLPPTSEHEETMRAFFPRARFATVAGASHFVHADKPREVVALLRDFFAE